MLLQEDSVALSKICLFYSMLSCVFYSMVTAFLYYTQLFLYAGNFTFIPVFSCITLFQVFQWIAIQLKFEKDFTVYAKRGRGGLSAKVVNVANKLTLAQTFKGGLSCVVCVLAYYALAVFFGAELLDNHEATLMFSILMSVLTALPVCIYIGPNILSHLLGSKTNTNGFVRLLIRNIQLTLVGAWVGAFVIPLDWDRPWQKWPIPCSLGALIGHLSGHLFTLVMSTLSEDNFSQKPRKMY